MCQALDPFPAWSTHSKSHVLFCLLVYDGVSLNYPSHPYASAFQSAGTTDIYHDDHQTAAAATKPLQLKRPWSQEEWHRSVIPALERLNWVTVEWKTILSHSIWLCLKTNNEAPRPGQTNWEWSSVVALLPSLCPQSINLQLWEKKKNTCKWKKKENVVVHGIKYYSVSMN